VGELFRQHFDRDMAMVVAILDAADFAYAPLAECLEAPVM
jgi:hypothetical protein